ncbi:hypothetical protein KKF84_07295 [Myxococcota bacterium]|nr:hypothetical protein [Myxococcota bacterium]
MVRFSLALALIATLLSCSMDNLAVYCTDLNGSFHFKGAIPPLKPGVVEKIWDIKQQAIVFEAVPDYTVGDLGDIGPTYILMVNYGATEIDPAMTVFKNYLIGQDYCGNLECIPEPFTLGENSGQKILWRSESKGYTWYARDYIFKREGILYHISIQSIERESRPEYDMIVRTFTPGPPPEPTTCRTEIALPTYNPSSLFN